MSEIKQSFTEFVAAHPKMKFMFFGGKGGVGKTVMAGVTALHLARAGQAHHPGLHQPGAQLERLARPERVRRADRGQRRPEPLGLRD